MDTQTFPAGKAKPAVVDADSESAVMPASSWLPKFPKCVKDVLKDNRARMSPSEASKTRFQNWSRSFLKWIKMPKQDLGGVSQISRDGQDDLKGNGRLDNLENGHKTTGSDPRARMPLVDSCTPLEDKGQAASPAVSPSRMISQPKAALPQRQNLMVMVFGGGFVLCCLIAYRLTQVGTEVPSIDTNHHIDYEIPLFPFFGQLQNDASTAAHSDPLDVGNCAKILDKWNQTSTTLHAAMQDTALSPDVRLALEVMHGTQVLPGLSSWTYIWECAKQNAHHVVESTDMDCSTLAVTLQLNSFVKSVKATGDSLCSVRLLSHCSPPAAIMLADDSIPSFHNATRPTLLRSNLNNVQLETAHAKLRRLAEESKGAASNQEYLEAMRNGQTKVLIGEGAAATAATTVVTGGFAAAGGKAASAVIDAGIVAEQACMTAPNPLCVDTGVAILALSGVAFTVGVLDFEFQEKTPALDGGKIGLLDAALLDAEDGEDGTKADLDALTQFADMLFAMSHQRSQTIANTIKAKLQGMEIEMNSLNKDMIDVQKYAIDLKTEDDTRINNWNNCWFLCGPEPIRVVPEKVGQLAATMKQEFTAWDSSAITVIHCCKNVDSLCSSDILQTELETLQRQFRRVNTDWILFKNVLCADYAWTICTGQIVHTELRALYELHIQHPQPWWHASLAGMFALLMWYLVVGTKGKTPAGAREPLLA